MCWDCMVGQSRRFPATPGTVAPATCRASSKGPANRSQNVGHEPGRGRLEMPAARRTGGRPLSSRSAPLKKPLLVTGRERRQPRRHAQPPPSEHTHPVPLPPPTSPAGRLPSSPWPGLQWRPPAHTAPTCL